MTSLWLPGATGPLDQFVDRLMRQIADFAGEAGIERPVVEVELADSARFTLDSISAEPGYGFVTLRPHPGDDDGPEVLIVPVAWLRRIELRRAADEDVRLGFTLPQE